MRCKRLIKEVYYPMNMDSKRRRWKKTKRRKVSQKYYEKILWN